MTTSTHLDLYAAHWMGSLSPTFNSPDTRNLLLIVIPSDSSSGGTAYMIEATRSHYQLWTEANMDREQFTNKVRYIGTFPVSATDANGIAEECVPLIVQRLKEDGALKGTPLEQVRASFLSDFQQVLCDEKEHGAELAGWLVRAGAAFILGFAIGGGEVPSTSKMLLGCVLWVLGLGAVGLRLYA
ncbi:uncharacterized protein DSM5745_08150 [Aspergillus mulundensis]|uniref:Uncharacterized protein n=1 Tax=Aspergillus mulundensis TaxID=1810919 RepID=A0A3D8R9B2_9EURO|nr:hypothetical protein DSM5745_08150 [Aspergillus mulundensis]RDW70639.1 hypothetical protein DSM5745_08150 [Aspergillus mulundensis]